MIVTFMTFNIQHCKDYVKKTIDVDLMVKTIKECQGEIVGLNEVYGEGENARSQAEEVAAKLGYHYYFAPAIIHSGKPYGNAIVSKYPITAAQKIMIPDPIRDREGMYETRSIIKATFANLNFTLITTHIGLIDTEQINAVKTITDLIKTISTPIVLMGDFNMEPDNTRLAPIKEQLKNTLDPSILSFPSIDPVRRIDYIFTSSDIEVIEAAIPPIVASDHFPHIAKLNIQ